MTRRQPKPKCRKKRLSKPAAQHAARALEAKDGEVMVAYYCRTHHAWHVGHGIPSPIRRIDALLKGESDD